MIFYSPVCGDVAGLRVTNNTRHAKLGVARQQPVHVGLLDTYGNPTDITDHQLQCVTMRAEGLDDSKLTKTLQV